MHVHEILPRYLPQIVKLVTLKAYPSVESELVPSLLACQFRRVV